MIYTFTISQKKTLRLSQLFQDFLLLPFSWISCSVALAPNGSMFYFLGIYVDFLKIMFGIRSRPTLSPSGNYDVYWIEIQWKLLRVYVLEIQSERCEFKSPVCTFQLEQAWNTTYVNSRALFVLSNCNKHETQHSFFHTSRNFGHLPITVVEIVLP
jgi:hypothetical protein